MPDVIGYLRLLGRSVPPPVERAAAPFRYNAHVFVAPPWRDIFEQDSERNQTFDEAPRTFGAMVAMYGGLGYHLLELPCAAVDTRVRFVRERTRRITATPSRSPRSHRAAD